MVEQAAQRTQDQGVTGGQLALWLGLLAAIVALTTAMGQIERGANRIYGIERDRPALRKYGRALLMALTAGLLLHARIPRHHRRRCSRRVTGRGVRLGPHLRDVVDHRLLASRGRAGLDVIHRHPRAGTASAAAGVLLAGVRLRCVAHAVAAADRTARALRRQERVVRHYLRTVDRDLRPAALGQPVLGGALPRHLVRRAARGCPRGSAGPGFG